MLKEVRKGSILFIPIYMNWITFEIDVWRLSAYLEPQEKVRWSGWTEVRHLLLFDIFKNRI